MQGHRLALAVGCAVGFAAALLPASALAATSPYADSAAGIEIYATSTLGVFTGAARGDLPGGWAAAVEHTPLSGSPEESAAIDGGSFDLVTSLNRVPAVVTGAFTGGTVQQTGGSGSCGNQVFAVDGTLGDVGRLGGPGTGTGTFTATLTHYRVSIFGSCITYGASITGGVLTLSF